MALQHRRTRLNHPYQRPKIHFFVHERRLPGILLAGLEFKAVVPVEETPDAASPSELLVCVFLVDCQRKLSISEGK